MALPWEPGQPTPTASAATATTSSPTRVELPAGVPLRLLEREPVGLQGLTGERPGSTGERATPGDWDGTAGHRTGNTTGSGNAAGDVHPTPATDDVDHVAAGDITTDDVAPRDDAADNIGTDHLDPASALRS